MNYLNKRRCYLSGPIQHDVPVDWRTRPRAFMSGLGIDLFDPVVDPKQQWAPSLHKAAEDQNYEKMAEVAADFVHKDLTIVDRCDFIVSYLPHKIPTYGTTHEIINSNDRKKPTLLVCEEGKNRIPYWFFGFINHNHMFGSWDALFQYLSEVDSGQHKDDYRWAYVYGLI